jgi:hypothetical protein
MTREQDNIERMEWTLQDPAWTPSREYLEKVLAAYKELRAEVERLRSVEKAAQAAYDYHMTGYNAADDFDANTQIELMDALGRALEPKPDVRALLPELAVIAQVMKERKPKPD